jgi:hypothetical protein
VKKTNYQSIDEYIRTFPDDIQSRLESMRQIIKSAIPGAILSFRGKKEFEFTTREIGNDNFTTDISIRLLEESYLESFLISHVVRLSKFIISFMPLYGRPDSIPPYMEILAKDKRFTQVLRKVKTKFDETHAVMGSLERKSSQ